MEHPIPRPLGLAALITATVTLLSPGMTYQAGQSSNPTEIAPPTPNGIALSTNHAFSPSVATALVNDGASPTTAEPLERSLAHGLRTGQTMLDRLALISRQQQAQVQNGAPRISKELPEDIRSARLMLSIESLFKATTPN